MSPPPLSVVIVSWNGMRHLPRCLATLAPQLPPGTELVLVDNGSSDGMAGWARGSYPRAHVIGLRTNLGFAGGVNAGLRAATSDLLLLLNDDAFAAPGCIDALLAAMGHDAGLGAASGVLLFDHRPDLVASAGVRVRRDALALDLWAGRAAAELPTEPQPIFGPSGGAALYRRALLADVGLMEPGFFNYLEDVDLAWRAQLRGWRSAVVPAARARHIYSATAGQGSPFKQRLLGRNRLRTIVRCLPTPLLRRYAPAIASYDLLAIGYAALTRNPDIVAGRWAGLRELPTLLHQRRAIQARRTATIEQIAHWLEPALPPWQTLREQRRLDTILRARPG
ncbi:MAG: glycosyltransferase family 2 protein [Kouleothrix sp.]